MLKDLTQHNTVIKTENQAPAVASFFVWLKSDIPKDLAYKYWRDIHAVWVARAPGFYQCRQLHFENVCSTLLSNLEGIEVNLPKEDQPDGMAHVAYSSALIANLLRKPFALKLADEDNVYFIARNTYQRSILPLSGTYTDKINSPQINGPIKQPRYFLAFKKNKDTSEEEFRDFMIKQLAQLWSQKNSVLRLRLELLAPHKDTQTSPKGVLHSWDQDKQYQAWIEVWLSEETKLNSLFDQSVDYKKNLSAIHAYPISAIYTVVYGKKPTLVGLRGYPAAKIIEEIGSNFQKSTKILKFTYGPVINGAKLLGQSFYTILILMVVIGLVLGGICWFS